MTDINEWNLSYATPGGDVDYDFGHSSNNSPFTVQVDVGDADRSTVDQQHGTADATLMGRDLLGGRDLTFTLTTLRDLSGGGVAVNAADKVSEFAAKWRAPSLVKAPGEYAVLTNKWRNRWVMGRPRQFTPKYNRLRKGLVEYLAVFHTVSPDFYGTTEHTILPVRTVNFPQDIGGDLPTWPIITFTGLFTTATLTWVPPGLLTGWSLSIAHLTTTGITARIDTRPWSRSAKDSAGRMQNGWLDGDKMDDCLLYPSTGGHFLFTTTGSTDANTKCEVSWFDAYASL